IPGSKVSHNAGSPHIDTNCFVWILLHQGNVFICRSMKDDFRTKLPEYLFHPGAMRDIRREDCEPGVQKLFAKLVLDIEKRSFSLVNQDDLIALEACKLSGNFRPDRAGSTGNHDSFPGKPLLDGVNIEFYGFAPKQILQVATP